MKADRDLDRFKELLLSSCGMFFTNERELTLSSAVTQRMSQRGIDTAELYHSLLTTDQDEFRRFIELLTVNETYFSRENDHLKLLVDKIIPEILSQRETRPVRIVSAGCSTGEEPYSIAMMLAERFGEDSGRLFYIAGTDIDSSVIARAKQGIYGKGSFRSMDKAIQDRYFKMCGPGAYQLGDIRHQVHFEVVNLKDALYPAIMQQPDIILYRNVSIYFPPQVQREIFGRLALILNEGGYLFVGATETLQHNIGLLTLMNRDSVFFYRKIPGVIIEERRSAKRNLSPREQSKPGSSRQTNYGGVPAGAVQSGIRAIRAVAASDASSVTNSRDPKSLFDDALELAISRRMDDALALLDAIIEQDGSFIKAHSLKGSIFMSASRFQEAVAVCNAILSHDPLCLEAYLMLGVTARHSGDDDDAQRRFREAIYLKSSCWLAHFYLAEILFGQGDKNRARTGYEAALRVLENGSSLELSREYFPLSYNAEQYMAICRHKLSLLKNG
ncbi:protein-glutamate O-methyltransferase CheR [Geobacter sp. OR-1]|uniref:CheR family methyltransferase n=1 Tax=Geobacter sp. OR-1 TaxID=1266765 RepID=UPI001364AAFC|nr:protein-glutamate O-methyltransferase CheR [Geobacter sp. OR-1]